MSFEKEKRDMTGKEVVEKHLKYNLQSWSKQKGLNPIPIEKQKEFICGIMTEIDIQICRHS